MNRTETRQRLIELGIAGERVPIDGRFDLTKADLTKANLSGAYLSGANLSEANLRDVYKRQEQYRAAILAGGVLP